MPTYGYISVEDIKKEIAELGWQWVEHHFNDNAGIGDTAIKLTQSKDNQYFCNNATGELGWGRFIYSYCWHSAYDYIVLGLRDAAKYCWMWEHSAYRSNLPLEIKG